MQMNEIYELERKMWDAAVSGDKPAFLDIVSQTAVMVCGGYRCTGAEYAGFIGDFGVAAYEISGFEMTAESDDMIAVHYIVNTKADGPENADMAGKFHVASVWKRTGGKWQLVFNMDSRIMGE